MTLSVLHDCDRAYGEPSAIHVEGQSVDCPHCGTSLDLGPLYRRADPVNPNLLVEFIKCEGCQNKMRLELRDY